MKKSYLFVVSMVMCVVASAQPSALGQDAFRVAVLDFTNQSGELPSYVPAAALSSAAIADKGAFLLNKKLTSQEGFRLIDRRDFFEQMEKFKKVNEPEPSYLRAAQQLNTDVVLRGSLLSLSSSRSAVQQGGYTAYLDDITVRVGLEALDTRDGSVLAAVDGTASRKFRQTGNVQTTLGEDDVLMLMDGALAETIPAIKDALVKKQEEFKNKPTVKLSIATDDDPALIEIDGLLIGSSPITDFEVYQGDHTITIGKPGYREISKRILLEKSTRIQVPMLKTQLDADEIKDVLDKASVNIYSGIEPALIIETAE
jgi:hypothetical protein